MEKAEGKGQRAEGCWLQSAIGPKKGSNHCVLPFLILRDFLTSTSLLPSAFRLKPSSVDSQDVVALAKSVSPWLTPPLW